MIIDKIIIVGIEEVIKIIGDGEVIFKIFQVMINRGSRCGESDVI